MQAPTADDLPRQLPLPTCFLAWMPIRSGAGEPAIPPPLWGPWGSGGQAT